MTNNHVIEGSDEIKVTIERDKTEKEYDAKLVGTDPKTDIALIQIKMEDGKKESFPFLKLGDSDNLEVGEWVVAIGNPFGLSHTVTVGVVSAKGRSIGSGPYDEYIQTDASINPGNSGGPLLNIKGDVIGMNTAIISGNSGGNVGIGFAIPINMAKAIMSDLKEKGSVTRGWLGVMIQKITPDLAKSFGLKESDGALVGDVIPGGPAEKAGIKRGDVIVKFNGQDIKSMESLPKYVAGVTPGKKVDLEIVRDGKRKTMPVTIAVLKDKEAEEMTKHEAASDLLGIQVQDITKELAESLQLDTTEGVLIAEVMPGEAGAESGLRRGDVIAEMNKKPIKSISDYNEIASKVKAGDTVLFLLKRGGSTIYVAVKMK
jgi:serine protease Do